MNHGSKKLTTTVEQCVINKSCKGIKDTLVFHLDLATYYNSDSQCFGNIKEDEKFRTERIIFLQLFLRLLENIKTVANSKNIDQKRPKKRDAIEDVAMVDARSLQFQEAGLGVGDANDPSTAPADMVNVSDDEKSMEEDEDCVDRIEKDGELQASDEDDNQDSTATSLFEVFIEAIASKDWDGKGAPQNITAYRFWAFNYCDSIDVNMIWSKIVEEAISFNQFLIDKKKKVDPDSVTVIDEAEDRKQSRRGAPPVTVQPFEQWKRLVSPHQLASLYDQYTGKTTASNRGKYIKETKLSSNLNPLCATEIFSHPWCMRLSKKKTTYVRQGAQNFAFYARRNEHDGLRELFWPIRKLVYKVLPEDVAVFILLNKYLPHQDKQCQNFCVNILPALLEDPKIFLKDDDLDGQEDVEQMIAKKKKEDADDELEMDLLLNPLFSEQSNTVSNIQNYKLFDSNGLLACKWELIDHILGLKTLSSTLLSSLGPIYATSTKNRVKLQNIYANRMSFAYLRQLQDVTRVTHIMNRLNRETVFKRYIATCISEKSDISPCGKIMMREAEANKLLLNERFFEKLDPSLTDGADTECRFSVQLDKVYGLISAHTYGCLAYKNSLDAYNMSFDRVHNNMITYSEGGATGKSFLWGLIEKHFRMKDTVNVVTYESAKSRAVDGCYNDQVIIFDEIESAIMDKKGGSDGDKERTWKMLLSNNKVSAKILVIDPLTGVRTTKTTFSEQITVFFGSTNKSLNCISDAMGRRFHLIIMDEKPYSRKSITEVRTTEDASVGSNKGVYKTIMNKHHHLVQLLVYHVEKLIYLGGLTEVTMDVANVTLLHVSNELMIHGYVEPNPTMYERIMTTARMNTILEALYKLFFYKGSKYQGKPIEISNLMDLEPYLFCTSQHIVSAIGETIDVLIDPLEYNIRNALRTMHKNFDSNTKKYKVRKGNVLTPNGLYSPEDISIATWLRFKLDRTLDNLCGKILEAIMRAEVTSTNRITPSVEAIKTKLLTWTKRRFKCYEYQFDRNLKDDSLVKPERIIMAPPFQKGETTIAIAEEHCYYIHYEYIYDAQAMEFEAKKSKLDVKYGVSMGGTAAGYRGIEDRKKTLMSDEGYMKEIEKIASVPRYTDRYVSMRKAGIDVVTLNLGLSPEERLQLESKEKEILDFQKKYDGLDNDVGPGDFVGKLLVDLLTRKFQVPQRLPFTNYPDHPSVRKILEITQPEHDAAFIILPVVNHISEIDKRILDGIGMFVDTLNTKKYWLLDCDLDTFGIQQRNGATYCTQNPISKTLLSDDPLEKFFQENKKNKIGPEPVTKSNGTNLFSKGSSFIVSERDDGSEDEIERFALKEGTNVYEMLQQDTNVYENMYSREMEHGIMGLNMGEAYTEGDSDIDDVPAFGFIPGNEDDGYDRVHGYFLGTSLAELYTDDANTVDKLTAGTLKNIYKKLDQFDSNDIFDDINFDIPRFALSTKPNGDTLYHWDVLAKERGISVDIWEEMIKRGTISQSCMEPTDPQTLVYIPDDMVVDKDLEFKVLKYNVRIYKQVFAHPWVYKDLENRKHYQDQKHYGSYPQCMFYNNIINNRHERWTAINEISKDEKVITQMMLNNNDVHCFGYTRKLDDETGTYEVKENKSVIQRFVSTFGSTRIEEPAVYQDEEYQDDAYEAYQQNQQPIIKKRHAEFDSKSGSNKKTKKSKKKTTLQDNRAKKMKKSKPVTKKTKLDSVCDI